MTLMGALRDNSSHVVFSLACFFICSDFQTMLCGAPGVRKGCPGDVWEWQKKSKWKKKRVGLLSALYLTRSCWPLTAVCIGLLCNISFGRKKKKLKNHQLNHSLVPLQSGREYDHFHVPSYITDFKVKWIWKIRFLIATSGPTMF